MGMTSKIVSVGSILLFTGCTTIVVEPGVTDRSVSYAFGVTRIDTPAQTSQTTDIRADTLGSWVGPAGIGLGYLGRRQLSIGSECQIVFIIEGGPQLETALDLAISSSQIEKGTVCAVS